MNLQDFSNVVRFEGLTPETHDFYLATFNHNMDQQGFLDYAYEKIPDLQGIWFKTVGNNAYFVVAKDTAIPEDFAGNLIKIQADLTPEPEEQ
jgi:hypothetical protein